MASGISPQELQYSGRYQGQWRHSQGKEGEAQMRGEVAVEGSAGRRKMCV